LPTHKSAEKRMKTAEKARLRNRGVNSQIREALKNVQDEKDAEKKAKNLNTASGVLDRAVSKGVIPKNKAARTKSRLAKAANKK
jgi:small subunit ribosomal protein S20